MTGSCCGECADSGNASRAWRSNRTRLGPPPLCPVAISCGRGPARPTDAGPGEGRTALQQIRTGLVDGLAFPGIVDSFLDGGWRSWGDGGGGADESSEEEVETWRILHRDIVGEHGRGVTLNTYLQRLDLSSKTPPPAPNAIPCITVHRSKGLQFRHVYLIGMAQEVFPSYRALKGGQRSKEVQEERRSCFVAITRARETLTLTRARQYYGYVKGPSQFLGEMGV